MDFKVILLLLGILAGTLAFGFLRSGGEGPSSHLMQTGPEPVIREIDFPGEIPAVGQPIGGALSFLDPQGDIVEARFEVLEAVAFESFTVDLAGAAGITHGSFTFELHSALSQEVVLKVTLVDAQGHESEPYELRFSAIGQPAVAGGP